MNLDNEEFELGLEDDEDDAIAGVPVRVLVNGQEVGTVSGTMLLGLVIQEYGARQGLRTVVAFSGDRRLTADQASESLEDLGVTSLEIRTKDQRA